MYDEDFWVRQLIRCRCDPVKVHGSKVFVDAYRVFVCCPRVLAILLKDVQGSDQMAVDVYVFPVD